MILLGLMITALVLSSISALRKDLCPKNKKTGEHVWRQHGEWAYGYSLTCKHCKQTDTYFDDPSCGF